MHGRLLVKVIKSSNLYSDSELPSPYCKLTFGRHNTAVTKSCLDTIEPIWNETFHFPVNKLSDLLEIKVKDAKNIYANLGVYILSTEEAKLNSNIEKTYILQKKDKKEIVSGSITLKVAYLTNESIGSLQLQIIEAIGLRSKKKTPTYVVLKYGSQKLKTSLSNSSLNPTWNETFSITLWGPNKFKLIVVKNNRSVIGYATVNLLDYKNQFDDVITLPIRKRKKLKGDIKIKLHYKGNLGNLLADYSEDDSESVESSFDQSIESSEQTTVTSDTSITDSSISSSSVDLDEHNNETLYICINKAQCVHDNPKEEFYFKCSTNVSSFTSFPQSVDDRLIVWDESFHMQLSSLSEPFSINFFNKKYKFIGSTIISLSEIKLDSFSWLDVIPNGTTCDLSKIYANISLLPKPEKDAIDYELNATVVSIVNIKNNTPIVVKCSSTSNHIDKSTGVIRSNDNRLEIRERFTYSIKSFQEEYIFSVYKVSRSHKLIGSYVLDARILNQNNNYFLDRWFTLQSRKKDVPNLVRIRLKLKAFTNKLGLFNKFNRTHDANINEKSADMVIKLVVIGPSNSGKTSIMNRFVDEEYNKNLLVTIIDFKKVIYNLEGQKIMIIIKDTSGMERFAELTESYYRNVDGMFVVFDKCEEKSLARAIAIYNKALESFHGLSCMLLGNKCENLRKVEVERVVGEKFAEENNLNYKEVSAKENININEAFSELIEEIYLKKTSTHSKDLGVNKEGVVNLEDSHIEKKRCCLIL